MNNIISIIMLGIVLAVCINFMFKVLRKPEPEKETQKGVAIGLGGAGGGFIAGLLIAVIKPQAFFSDSFLMQEGAELGAIALLAIGFSVIGAIVSLLVFGYFRKRKA